jgi:hypothetical protein
MQDHVDRPTGPKPRDQCREAECLAVAIRKALLAQQRLPGEEGHGGSRDSALQLAEMVEHLARLGQDAGASEAVEIAAHIEVLTSMLSVEVDFLLKP